MRLKLSEENREMMTKQRVSNLEGRLQLIF
jgi:hypothetical protein